MIRYSADHMNEENIEPSVETTPESSPAIRMRFDLICTSKVKKYALAIAKTQIRTKNHTRVSEDFLMSCEAALRNHIVSRVKMQPTKGKTLT